MKTISIEQPYASLLAEGIKTIILRNGNNAYRGDILIRASRNSYRWIDDNGEKVKLPTECLLFVGELVDIQPMKEWHVEAAMSEFNIGKYSWMIKRKYFVEPIPCAGKAKLHDTPDELIKPLTDEEAYARFPQLIPRTTHPFRATVREYHVDRPPHSYELDYEINRFIEEECGIEDWTEDELYALTSEEEIRSEDDEGSFDSITKQKIIRYPVSAH